MKKLTQLMGATLLIAAPLPAFAQGMPVHDSASLIQQINTVRQALQMVEQGKEQIAEAQKLRMVAMPLLQGRAMRLAIDYGRVNAECTLFFDAVQIEEEDAVAFLMHFTAGIEAPLRLLV